MGVTIFRPGQRLVIPAPGVQVWAPRAASAAATWWDNNGAISGCVAAYAPKGAADLASSYINLANPGTYNAAPGVAPTWDAATGWIFSGTSYLSTGFTPANENGSYALRIANVAATSAAHNFGAYNGSSLGVQIAIKYVTATRLYCFNMLGATQNSSVFTGDDIVVIAGQKVFLNGTQVITLSGTGTPGVPIFIGRSNNNGVPSAGKASEIRATSIYNSVLSDAQVATLTTAIQAL